MSPCLNGIFPFGGGGLLVLYPYPNHPLFTSSGVLAQKVKSINQSTSPFFPCLNRLFVTRYLDIILSSSHIDVSLEPVPLLWLGDRQTPPPPNKFEFRREKEKKKKETNHSTIRVLSLGLRNGVVAGTAFRRLHALHRLSVGDRLVYETGWLAG